MGAAVRQYWFLALTQLVGASLGGCSGGDDGGTSRGGGAAAFDGQSGTGDGDAPVNFDPAGTVLADDLRGEECGSFSQTARNNRQPADIIWAVDNGGNIQSDIQYIRDNMNAFSRQIIDSGIDVHLVLITDALDPDVVTMATPLGGPAGDWRSLCIDAPLGSGQCPEDTNLPSFLHVDYEVGIGHDIIPLVGNHPLNVFIDQYPAYRSAMRRDATKTFVAVTDVDAVDPENNSAEAFIQNARALDGDMFAEFKFSGVVAVGATCPATLFPPQVGQVYIDLAAQTGGVVGDLCKMEFGPVFDDIAQGIIGASQLQCEWQIPEPPEGQVFNPGKVNVIFTGQAGEQAIGRAASATACTEVAQGWYYDDPVTPSRVIACPQSCDFFRAVEDGKVDVLFGCETIVAGPQ